MDLNSFSGPCFFLNDLKMKVVESKSTIYLKNDYGGGNVFEPSRL